MRNKYHYRYHIMVGFFKKRLAFLKKKIILYSNTCYQDKYYDSEDEKNKSWNCWRRTGRALYAGMLNNWGPHLVDQALQLLDSPIESMWADVQHNVAAGDADDQIKLLLRGVNKRVVDMEISTCTTMPGRLYEVWGDLGSLVVPLEENSIKLRYLDPKQKLEPLEAVPGEFPLLYGNAMEKLSFIDEVRPCTRLGGHVLQRGELLPDGSPVDPAKGYSHPDTMWSYIYQSITRNAPYPVKTEEGLAVMELIGKIREISGYTPHESFLSGKNGRFAKNN